MSPNNLYEDAFEDPATAGLKTLGRLEQVLAVQLGIRHRHQSIVEHRRHRARQPPTLAEVDAFLADRTSGADEAAVDRLLDGRPEFVVDAVDFGLALGAADVTIKATSIGKRRHELATIGQVADTGRRAPTDTGRSAVLWQITSAGRQAMQL